MFILNVGNINLIVLAEQRNERWMPLIRM